MEEGAPETAGGQEASGEEQAAVMEGEEFQVMDSVGGDDEQKPEGQLEVTAD